MSIPPIEHIRGMSEPVFYAFNMIGKSRRMVAHAIIFTSFEVADDCQMQLLSLEDGSDPRKLHFLRYLKSNVLERPLKEVREQIEKSMKELADLEAKITAVKEQLKSLK